MGQGGQQLGIDVMKGERGIHFKDVWPREVPDCPCTQPCTPVLLTSLPQLSPPLFSRWKALV